MARRFVVEAESLAVETSAVDSSRELEPRQLACRGGRFIPRLTVNRAEWVQCEQVLEVGEEQFLVLLLVVQPELHARHTPGIALRIQPGDEAVHMLIHVCAVAEDVVNGWPREQAAHRPRKECSHRLVVGVEQIAVLGMESAVAGQQGRQQKVLEEPRGMREMPLGRAALRGALDHIVLDGERAAELGRQLAYLGIRREQLRVGAQPGLAFRARAGCHLTDMSEICAHAKPGSRPRLSCAIMAQSNPEMCRLSESNQAGVA